MTTRAQALPIAKTEEGFEADQVLSVVSGHFVHDTFSAFLAPLQPLLIDKLALSLTQAGSLVTFMTLPALLNPFVGYLADRASLRYFVILAPAVTATLMGSLGLAPTYLSLVVMLVATGISVAAFHSPAPAMVARVSGKQVGKGMSWFMAAGELGRTIGPLLAVWAVSMWTLDGSYRIVALGWAASLILFLRLRHVSAHSTRTLSLRTIAPTVRRLFAPMVVLIFFRQFLHSALTGYLPIYMDTRGASLAVGAGALSLLELAGVGGALVGGTLSDRVGRKPVLLVALVGASIFMLIFLRVDGWLLVLALLGMGFTSLAINPVLLATVQDHLPENRAVASGLYISTGFLARSLTVLLVGVLGDRFGLHAAF